ncbi:glycosyl transferase family 2 [Thiorhodococcus drewsii AZ1]|uniref:Glycosyl transferase family 2 n=1 Tax=Thiorhodococcus drewsii AZ1 TaxID=765913 RepID=G2E5A4_9GAMM|nr:glycosyltransferase family 2 protein [Thiorhodococcus drewsii]EGV28816.1 glycosyl transferase family 2 [Thiorhodococcus drewsii AZ1]
MKISNPDFVTLVIPVYNESSSIVNNLRTIIDEACRAPEVEYELLVIDDGSNDDTVQLIDGFRNTEPSVKLLSFTRNFGKEAAIQAGLEMARGDAVIILDSDLQHPPSLIPEMINLWRAGVPVVEAVKHDESDSRTIERFRAELFYRIFKWLSGLDLQGHSDYKLLDRQVLNCYLSWPERKRFFRGLIEWASFPCARIPFIVPEGSRSDSRWGWLALTRYAIDNLTSFSSMPLRIFSLFGMIVLALGAGIGFLGLWQKFQGYALDGFTTINLLIIFIGGSILLGIGIIGHYLARIYEEVKQRPTYLLRSATESNSLIENRDQGSRMT